MANPTSLRRGRGFSVKPHAPFKVTWPTPSPKSANGPRAVSELIASIPSRNAVSDLLPGSGPARSVTPGSPEHAENSKAASKPCRRGVPTPAPTFQLLDPRPPTAESPGPASMWKLRAWSAEAREAIATAMSARTSPRIRVRDDPFILFLHSRPDRTESTPSLHGRRRLALGFPGRARVARGLTPRAGSSPAPGITRLWVAFARGRKWSRSSHHRTLVRT